MKKRILSLVLCFCMILSQLPVSALAEEIITTPAVTLSIESSTLTLGVDTTSVTAALIDGAFTQTGDAAVEISVEGDAAELTDGILTPLETGEVTVTASLTGTPYSEDNPEGYILADGYNGDAVSQKITIEELQREECTVSSDDSNDILQDDSEAELSLDAVTNDANAANAAEICAIGGTTYSSITKALSAANTGTIKLLADVTETADIKITSGKTITLDLNDHILNLYGHRIINKGILTLCDSAAETSRYFTDADGDGCYEGLSDTSSTGAIEVTGGVITGGNASAENAIHGGAVCNNSTFYMNGGNIVGNKIASGNANSALGGGVYNKGTFVMNGGMIAGNLVYGQTNTGADNSGGGVFNATGATFTLSNGTISCNKATGEGANDKGSCYGFGGGVCAFGTFNMKGGTLADNKAQENGGGVAAYSTLTLTGGTVSGNTARWGAGIDNTKATVTITSGTFTNNTAYGGGVVDNEGTLSVTGGTFENNKAVVGGGIYAFKNFTLGGSVQFTANKTKTGKVSNVYLSKSALITPDDYKGTCAVAKSGKTGVISTATDSKYLSSFTSENTSYGIHFNSDSALEISPFTVTVKDVAGGSIKSDQATAKKGDKVTLTITPDTGYQCTGCTVTRSDGGAVTVNNNTFTMPDSDVTVQGSFTQGYDINYVQPENGSVTGAASADAGDTVTLSSTPAPGYILQEYIVYKTEDSATKVTVTGSSFVMPAYNVTVTAVFITDTTDYLTFTSDAEFTITPKGTWEGTLEYSTDRDNWASVTKGNAISAQLADGKYTLYFRGQVNNKVISGGSPWSLKSTGEYKIAASGNIMTLLDYTDPDNAPLGEFAFYYMFSGCSSLASAPSLPATTLAEGCYSGMFSGCSSLASAPSLPATTLAEGCYGGMFYGCSSLTSAPSLPATTLAEGCYSEMFYGCSSLTSAPALPATKLAESCYSCMFVGCTSLASAPALPATKLAGSCYGYMFAACTALTRVPEISAADFSADQCCYGMFQGCTGINLYTTGVGECFSIPDTTLGKDAVTDMFAEIGSSGTFNGTPVQGTTYYYSQTDNTDYLTFTSDAAFSITPNAYQDLNKLEYSIDKVNWQQVSNTAIASSASAPYVLYFRGKAASYQSTSEHYWTLTPADGHTIAASGNMMTLLDYEDPDNAQLGEYAFSNMFSGCTSLTSAPALPATTLAKACYAGMFSGCTNLTSAPELPATTLALNCYAKMFQGCTALTRLPKICASDFSANGCCQSMFQGCANINLYTSGSGEYFCIPASPTPGTDAVTDMFKDIGSSGTFNGTPKEGTKYYSSPAPDYLTFTSDAEFTITPDGSWEETLEYSRDKDNWEPVTKGTEVSAALADGKYTLYFRGTDNTVITDGYPWALTPTGENKENQKIAASGNIMTLLDYTKLDNAQMGSYAFANMFEGCPCLISTPELPATALAESCYEGMFYGCTSLTSAPELPATTLAASCYNSMFRECTSLTNAPELPATTLADYCYDSMFSGCTSLASAPELPAKALAGSCYYRMFSGCTSLTSAPELPATTLAESCYDSMFYECTSLTSAPELPATTLAASCYKSMFGWCTSLTSAPELPATTLAASCYESMFGGCTRLTSAPELPATTLAASCYESMFGGCTRLTSAPELPATTLAASCYYSMFCGCTSLTSAPELPAIELAESCYGYMFCGCASLTSAPELPATALAEGCYYYMFDSCTSLTSAPELPATTLADYCYDSMFSGCTSLTSAPELPVTTLAASCYEGMFEGCTSLMSAPELPAETLAESCYCCMFSGCIALTRVPKISATNFSAEYCCCEMFQGCTGINLYTTGFGEYFIIPDTTDLGEDAVTDMFKDIGSSSTEASCPATPEQGVEYYYSQTPDTTDYLKFTSDAAFSIKPNGSWEGTLQYSTDKYNWASVEKGNAVSAELADGKYTLYFRGTGNTVISGGDQWVLQPTGEHKIAASGNIMTLLDYQDPDNAQLGVNAFCYMFFNWSNLESAPKLPAVTLAQGCYDGMFANCTSLSSAPQLPATTLAAKCYYYMFANCTSLSSAPQLPATTLARYCYAYMFEGCTSLSSAPELPATKLDIACFEKMFYNCSKLKVATSAPGDAGCYQIWRFPDDDGDSFSDMLTGTANALTVTSRTTYYLMTYDGQGTEGHHCYNTADNVSLSDNINKAIVGYTGSKLIVEPNTPSSYTLEKITVLTDSTAETDTPERDITAAKEIACNYGESAAVTVTSKLNVTVDKKIVTDEGITASESYLQAYVNTQKASATANTTYTFTVRAQETAIETLEDGTMLTFYDASLTKTVEGGAAETITDTGTNLLSFTIPYDMTGKKDLAVYRYCEGDEQNPEPLEELNMPVNMTDGSYYVSGTGADTQVTIFASSFSTYAIGAAHDHIWNYELSEEGNAIEAKCCNDAGTCDYTGTDNRLTIQAPESLVYDGNAHNATFGTATRFCGGGLPEIRYEYKSTSDGTYATATDTIKAGYYKASFTAGEGEDAKTASVEYTISKAAPAADDFTFTPPANCAWNDEVKEATVTAKDGISGMGEVTVKYYADAACENEKEPKELGTYYVGISVAEGDNYEAATLLKADTWKFEIRNIAASVTVKDGETETTTYYETLTDAWAAAQENGTAIVTMLANAEANLTNASGKDITLDLNGYVLKAKESGSVVTNNGTLTIQDSNSQNQIHYYTVGSDGLWTWDDSNKTGAVAYESLTACPDEGTIIAVKGGAITGGNKTGSGGGIYSSGNMTFNSGNVIGNEVTRYGGGIAIGGTKTLTFNSGKVLGNHTSGTQSSTGNGGGIAVAYNTTGYIVVNGGDISFNTADRYGGGMYAHTGSIRISGGTITYNYAKNNGGGGICNDVPVTVMGGTIKNNLAKNNGGAIFTSSTFTVDGSPVITDNHISNNVVCNVYPNSDKDIRITISSTTALAEGAEIGVTLASGTGSVTGTNSADYSMYFASDNTSYAVKNENNIVKLVDGYAITCADCENGSISVGNQKSAYFGETITVTATPADGYELDTLTYTPDGGSPIDITSSKQFEMPENAVTVNATFKAVELVCYIDADNNGTFDGNDVKYPSIKAALAVEKPAAETEAQPTVIRMIENSYENIFEVENDRYVTLDLNGYVLIKDEDVKPNLITNNGHLTVTDSNREAIHYYTVVYNGSLTGDSLIAIWDDANTDNAISIDDITEFPAYGTVVSVKGGAITSSHAHGGVENHGSFTLDGGNLIGNWATDTVGGGVNNTGTFNMNGGMICLNWGNTFGGGVANCGTFNMNGGVVKCNVALYGGGIANVVGDYNDTTDEHAVFAMTDGSVIGNIAVFGGGVANFGSLLSECQATSIFTMTGGTISNNEATQCGGVSNAAFKDYFPDDTFGDSIPVFTMLGGSITNNKASDPFGFADTGLSTPQYNGVYNAGTMTVGKTAAISGNTYNDKTENLCIKSGTIDIAADENQPADGMSIGVTLASGAGQFTSNGDSKDRSYFESDNESYIVKYNGENYLELLPVEVADAAYFASLTLNKNIDINFKMKDLGDAFDVANLGITVNGTAIGSDKITYSSTDQMVSCVLQATLPQDIGTPVNVVVTYNNVQVKKFTYSVKDYCDAVFAAYETYEGTDTTQGKLYSLCEAVLNYGKYAEDYKNGITSSTLNEEHAIDFTNYTVKCEDTDTTYAGYADSAYASLSLGSTITLNYVLTNCKVDLTDKNNFGIYYDTDKTLNSERVSVTKNDTETTVSIELYASELSTSYSMKLKGVDKEDFCITYGVYNYCSEVQSIDSTQYPAFTVTLKTLCKAIHNYGEAVQAYIEKQEI